MGQPISWGRWRLFGLMVVAAGWLAAPGVAGAQLLNIPAGDDFFQTDPANTDVTFRGAGGTALPAGFFGPGCPPVEGTFPLAGDALDLQNTGDTDTIVRRLNDANVAPGGPRSRSRSCS